jgi:hypothetical protein
VFDILFHNVPIGFLTTKIEIAIPNSRSFF